MPTFDSSALLSIPGATDATRGITQGLQLKDLIDEQEQRQLELSQSKQAAADQRAQRDALRGLDFSKPESYAVGAQRLSQAGYPEQAIALTGQFQKLQSGQVAQQRAQAQAQVALNVVKNNVLDTISSNATDLLSMLDSGGDPAQADAQVRAELVKRMPSVLQQLPADQPWAAQVKQVLLGFAQRAQSGQLSAQDLRNGLTREIQMSQQGQQHLQQQNAQLIAQHRLDLDTANAAERTRHDKAIESGNRYGIKEPSTTAGENLKDQFIGSVGGKVTLGQLRGMDFDALAKRGMTAQQLVQSGLQYSGNTAAAGAIGRRGGNVAILEGSFNGAADQVRSALQGVTRTNLQATNKAIAAGKTQFGDPGESRYAAAIQTAVNEYSRVVGGGVGASTDSARAEASRLLSRAQSPAQVQAVLKQMSREVDIVKRASGSAMSTVGAGQGAAPPAAAPAAPPANSGAGLPPGFVIDQ